MNGSNCLIKRKYKTNFDESHKRFGCFNLQKISLGVWVIFFSFKPVWISGVLKATEGLINSDNRDAYKMSNNIC